MIGAVAGDVIGSIYEFNNTRNYGFRLFTRERNFTDDSIMTMAVAYWLLMDHGHTHQGLEDIMVQMAKEFPCPMGAMEQASRYGCPSRGGSTGTIPRTDRARMSRGQGAIHTGHTATARQ